MRMKVRQMQEQMNNPNGYQQQANAQGNTTTQTKTNSAPSKGDYIDFEEVK